MLRHWLQYFGHEQIALIRSEEYFKDPRATLSRLFDHLGVDQPSDTASACVLLGLVWLRVCVCAPDLVYALWGAAADAASWSTLAGVRNLSGTVRAPCRLIRLPTRLSFNPPLTRPVGPATHTVQLLGRFTTHMRTSAEGMPDRCTPKPHPRKRNRTLSGRVLTCLACL